MALFHPIEETFVVAGTREEWLKRCEEALRATPHFQDVASSAELFRVSAKYRRPPVWGDIHVTLTPEGSGSTCVTARAMAFPNLFALIFSPERRIIDQFARALRSMRDHASTGGDEMTDEAHPAQAPRSRSGPEVVAPTNRVNVASRSPRSPSKSRARSSPS